MEAQITPFPERQPPWDSGGGSGFAGLVARVGMLETVVQDLRTTIRDMGTSVQRLEGKMDRHDDALRRIEDALRFLAEDHKAFAKSQNELREKVAHVDGRLANIPTTWQILALLATFLIGLSGLIFTASRFLHP